MPVKRYIYLIVFLGAIVVFRYAVPNQVDESTAVRVMSQIKREMTFQQIADLIPLTESHRLPIRQHGGVFYDVPLGRYTIQLRFEHSPDGEDPGQAKINFSPRLRDGDAFSLVAGVEESW